MFATNKCKKNDNNSNSIVIKYAVNILSWESRQLRKMKKKLDKAYKKQMTKRAVVFGENNNRLNTNSCSKG